MLTRPITITDVVDITLNDSNNVTNPLSSDNALFCCKLVRHVVSDCLFPDGDISSEFSVLSVPIGTLRIKIAQLSVPVGTMGRV